MIEQKIIQMLNPNMESGVVIAQPEHPLLGTLNKVISFLFHSRNQVHLWHLQTKSYAEHIALNGYYDSIVDLTDTFAEGAMSICGRPTNIISMEFKNYDQTCACEHLEFLCDQFYNITKEVGQYKDLENTCASILELLHKTKYLLTLK